jgi:hypothetical protein
MTAKDDPEDYYTTPEEVGNALKVKDLQSIIKGK